MKNVKTLSPKLDVVFQALFGEVGNESITKGFLETILERKIDSIDLSRNPILRREFKDEKLGVLDIIAKLDENEICNIELQIVDKKNIIERILYYWSRLYSRQIKSGEDYKILQKAIVILITDFKIENLEELDYHSRWKIMEDKQGKKIILTQKLEIDIIELPKIIGKEKLKKLHNSGFFMYGNHTNAAADALIPTMVSHPADTYVIVHPNNVSMPIFGKVTPYLGALPLPDDTDAAKNFIKEITEKITEKKCVMIYPEAHIWPFYTKIRPFTESSFRYPIQNKCPVMCFTNTYQKRKFGKKAKIVTYIDGPFYADSSLKGKAQKVELRNRVYEAMVERSRNNTLVLATYIKKK